MIVASFLVREVGLGLFSPHDTPVHKIQPWERVLIVAFGAFFAGDGIRPAPLFR